MKTSTLFLLTFAIWLTAKKRLGLYWSLATTNASAITSGDSAGGAGVGGSHASSAPAFTPTGNLNGLLDGIL